MKFHELKWAELKEDLYESHTLAGKYTIGAWDDSKYYVHFPNAIVKNLVESKEVAIEKANEHYQSAIADSYQNVIINTELTLEEIEDLLSIEIYNALSEHLVPTPHLARELGVDLVEEFWNEDTEQRKSEQEETKKKLIDKVVKQVLDKHR